MYDVLYVWVSCGVTPPVEHGLSKQFYETAPAENETT